MSCRSPAHKPGVNNATFDMVERIVDPDENIERYFLILIVFFSNYGMSIVFKK